MYNAGHSVVCERFIRTLQKKLYKCMISISKKLYINKFDEIVNKYNNAYHKTVKMKLIDVKSSKYNDLNKKNNKEDPIFEVGDHVRISKYKKFFSKGCIPNWFEESFEVKENKNVVPWTYVIKKLLGRFTKMN